MIKNTITTQNVPQEPLQGHKAGFAMKNGEIMRQAVELVILKTNGFTIDETVNGIIISKK